MMSKIVGHNRKPVLRRRVKSARLRVHSVMRFKTSISLVLLVGLAGCSTLPTNGPTRSQVEKSVKVSESGLPIQLVQVQTISDVPVSVMPLAPASTPLEPPPLPTDLIGAGDVLDINIYEAGVTLFSGGSSAGGISGSLAQAASTPGVQAQRLPPIRVDDSGNIGVPYAGHLHVAGHSVREVEAMVRDALRGMSQNPQVLITMDENITNSIIVGGEVGKPGRLVLQTNRERLTDAVALAGGYRGNTKDLLARVFHGDSFTDIRLNDLVDNPSLDMRMNPGDRLTLINDPRTYSVLGASGGVSQFPFSRSSVSMAEAIATAGGVNSNTGDPAAVFLFRYEKDAQGKEVPKVYHLNMMKAGTYFLAQRFVMKDKDVLYFGNAASNQPGKLLQLVSQMFTPLLTVATAVEAVRVR
jgi:polysaccharide export outer membrane protein